MTPLRARLHRIETVDVAGLLGGALNAILRAAEGGDVDEGARQTEWWESALGRPVDELAAQVDALRASAGYRAALVAFAAAQQWRARSLGHLHAAIVEGSERGYRRWRWSARAYLGAVERFVEEQAQCARAAAARPRLEADAGRANLRRSPVHASHFAALRERFAAADERPGAERQHAAERARDLLSEVTRREQERSALLQRRDSLRKLARAARISGDPAAGAATLLGQISAVERALRDQESAAAAANAAVEARALAAALEDAFAAQSSDAFAGYPGEPPLLLRLASALPPPPPRAQVPEPVDDAE
jgi:hypothetical protein